MYVASTNKNTDEVQVQKPHFAWNMADLSGYLELTRLHADFIMGRLNNTNIVSSSKSFEKNCTIIEDVYSALANQLSDATHRTVEQFVSRRSKPK